MTSAIKTISIPDWMIDLNSEDFDLTVEVSNQQDYKLNYDALAWLMQLRAQHPENIRYANMIFGNAVRGGEFVKGAGSIAREYFDEAETIRKHFKNKFMIQSLKGRTMSSFRVRATEVIDNPTVLRDSDIPVLLRLPDFYMEDRVMESLTRNHQSIDTDATHMDVEDRFVYVDRLFRAQRHNAFYRYYYVNTAGHLLCVKVDNDSQFFPMIRYFSNKSDGMGVRGRLPVHREVGYEDFRFYYLGKDYELY